MGSDNGGLLCHSHKDLALQAAKGEKLIQGYSLVDRDPRVRSLSIYIPPLRGVKARKWSRDAKFR